MLLLWLCARLQSYCAVLCGLQWWPLRCVRQLGLCSCQLQPVDAVTLAAALPQPEHPALASAFSLEGEPWTQPLSWSLVSHFSQGGHTTLPAGPACLPQER